MQTLAGRREVRIGTDTVFPTPLVLPSYSSRAIPPIPLEDAFESTIEPIVSPILVSAYDVFNEPGLRQFDFRHAIVTSALPMVFMDSGGYEALWNSNARAAALIEAADARSWCEQQHAEVLESWPVAPPLVAVTYDNPAEPPLAISDQVQRGSAMRDKWPQHACEILLKPGPPGGFHDAAAITPYVEEIARFAVIGVTEKECGSSMAERIRFLRALRSMIDAFNPGVPIHVFGGLDPAMTPLYFWAGADIFDGLTWLRFGYRDGHSFYAQSHISIEMPDAEIEDALWTMRQRNYRELTDLQVMLQRFLGSGGDETVFGPAAPRLRVAYERCVSGN